MPTNVTEEEAAATLEALVDRAAAGEEIVILRCGAPFARTVPVDSPDAAANVQALRMGRVDG